VGRPATLRVDIVADARGVGRGVADADSKLSRLGSSAKKFGLIAGAGLAAGAAAAFEVGKKLFEAGERADVANRRIEAINKSMGLFGESTDKVSRRIEKLAEKTSLQTGVDADSIKATQAKLLTFRDLAKTADTVGGSFDRATNAALDLAAAGFGTAETNATQLGKALQDPIKGLTSLRREGVTFTDTERKRIQTLVESNRLGDAQKLILSAIEKQVGGTARATATGTAKMSAGFHLVEENLGKKLLPVVDKFSNWAITKGLPAAQRFGHSLATQLGPPIREVAHFVTADLIPAIKDQVHWFQDKIVPVLVRTVKPVLQGIGSLFHSLSTAIERNRPELEKLGHFMREVATIASRVLGPVIGTTLKIAFTVLGDTIGTTLDVIGAIIDAISWLIDKIRDLVHWIDNSIGKVVNFAGKVAGVVGKLNPFAGDDIVGRSAGLIGPVGALRPDSDRLATAAAGDPVAFPFAGGSGRGGALVIDQSDRRVVIQVTGAVDPVSTARQIRRLLDDHDVRMGKAPAYSAAW
jgi:hypothetical protein